MAQKDRIEFFVKRGGETRKMEVLKASELNGGLVLISLDYPVDKEEVETWISSLEESALLGEVENATFFLASGPARAELLEEAPAVISSRWDALKALLQPRSRWRRLLAAKTRNPPR